MTISLIAAASENNVIGFKGKLPWHLKDDMKLFQQTTMHHPVIMGRKTFEALGKALPKRMNIVITSQKNFIAKDCIIVTSLEEAIRFAANQQGDEVFVIGGGEIYLQALPFAQKIYLSRVKMKALGDAFFPELKPEEWVTLSRTLYKASTDNDFDFEWMVLERTSENQAN